MPKVIEKQLELGIQKLSEMEIGSRGIVVEVENSALKLALLRIGFLEGDKFTLSEKAPFSGPIALRVNGGKVALRAADAQHVKVRRLQ